MNHILLLIGTISIVYEPKKSNFAVNRNVRIN